jgi:hypothetical protein
LPLSSAWDVFLRPLSASDSTWQTDVLTRGTRTLFFGGPFALLCLIACVRGGWHRRELVLAVGISIVLLFSTMGPIALLSQRYQFRDPLTFCAIPLAGIAAERGLRAARTRAMTQLLLFLQMTAIVTAVDPFLSRAWNADARGTRWFRGATGETSMVDALLAAIRPSERLLYSPEVDRKVMLRTLLPSGLGVNALACRGIPVVNGWLKGISAGSVWPNERLYYARISTPRALVESDIALDVLGIRYVVAERTENVARDLRERAVLETPGSGLVLYENENAWPGAFLLDEGRDELDIPVLATCDNDRLLCRDFTAMAESPLAGGVTVVRGEGRIHVTFDPVNAPRTLAITEMFRPEWIASSGGVRLETAAFAGSLLTVRVPPSTSSVDLVYRPWRLLLATIAAWCAIIGSLVVLGPAALRRGVGRQSRTAR